MHQVNSPSFLLASIINIFPAYYLPISCLTVPLVKTKKSTFCEWKGWATYYSVKLNGQEVKDRIWSYEDPTPGFKDLKGLVSFYVGPWGMFLLLYLLCRTVGLESNEADVYRLLCQWRASSSSAWRLLWWMDN